MFIGRILTYTITAAALLSAAPVLAEESNKTAEPAPVPACCERVLPRAGERAEASVKEGRGAARNEQHDTLRGDEGDLFQQHPYWNGP